MSKKTIVVYAIEGAGIGGDWLGCACVEGECGHSVNMYDKEPTNYCPICGCKVVSE